LFANGATSHIVQRVLVPCLLVLAAFASPPAPAVQTVDGITPDEDMPHARRGVTGTPAVGTTPRTFTVSANDVKGAAGAFSQTIEVVVRPDPTLDPAVRGVNSTQASAAARFGAAQIDNVIARTRMVHLGHDPCSTRIDIGTNIRWERTQVTDGQTRTQSANRTELKNESNRDRSRCERPFALWAAGHIDFGFLRPSSAPSRSDFRTSGVSLGADMKLRDGLVAGVALGYGREETEIDVGGSENQARAQSLMLYGSFEPLRSIRVDAMLGYGDLSFDARRWQAVDTVLLSGDRDGSQYHGSLALSAVWQSQGMKLAPYARCDHVRNQLDPHREPDSATATLNYGSMNVSADSIALGLYAAHSLSVGRATLEPGLRLEQRRVRIGGADQGIAYADLPQTGYALSHAAESDDLTSAALSLLLRFRSSLSIGVDYNYTASNDTIRNETVRALLRAPF
jgi:hypothetical protein